MALTAPDIAPEPVRPSQIQSAASAETFGGGPGLEQVNQEAQKISSDAGNIATFQKIRADQAAVEEAVGSKLSPALTNLIYDPQNGALAKINQSTTMKDTLKAQQDALDQYDKTAKDIAGKLQGPDQIGAFNQHALAYGDTLKRTLMAHGDQHIKQQDQQSFDSFVDNSIAQGSLGYGDKKNQEVLLDMMNEHAEQFAQRNGMTPDQLTDLKSGINSKFHQGVINQMLTDHKDQMASQYFQDNKDQITVPQIRDKVQDALEEGKYRGESIRATDSIWQKTGGNLQAAYAQADKELDPDLRDRIHQRLREKDNEVKEARTSDQDNAYYEASQKVGQAVKSGQQGTGNLMDIVSPDRWVRMSPSQQDGLKRMWSNDQNSDQVWTSYNLMNPTDKAQQSQSDFETEVLSRLDKSHKDKAMAMRNASLGNNPTSLTDHDQAKLIEKSVQESGIVPGLNPGKSASKLKGDAAATYGAFQDQAQEAIADFERNELGGRRRASQQETQKIVDQKILDTLSSSKPSFFTSVGRSIGLSAAPAVSFDKIPDDAKEQILTKARQMGKAVTRDQIENAYTSYQKKDLKGLMQALN